MSKHRNMKNEKRELELRANRVSEKIADPFVYRRNKVWSHLNRDEKLYIVKI